MSQQKVDAHQSCEEDIFAKGKEMRELITLGSGFLECDAKMSCGKEQKHLANSNARTRRLDSVTTIAKLTSEDVLDGHSVTFIRIPGMWMHN